MHGVDIKRLGNGKVFWPSLSNDGFCVALARGA